MLHTHAGLSTTTCNHCGTAGTDQGSTRASLSSTRRGEPSCSARQSRHIRDRGGQAKHTGSQARVRQVWGESGFRSLVLVRGGTKKRGQGTEGLSLFKKTFKRRGRRLIRRPSRQVFQCRFSGTVTGSHAAWHPLQGGGRPQWAFLQGVTQLLGNPAAAKNGLY